MYFQFCFSVMIKFFLIAMQFLRINHLQKLCQYSYSDCQNSFLNIFNSPIPNTVFTFLNTVHIVFVIGNVCAKIVMEPFAKTFHTLPKFSSYTVEIYIQNCFLIMINIAYHTGVHTFLTRFYYNIIS